MPVSDEVMLSGDSTVCLPFPTSNSLQALKRVMLDCWTFEPDQRPTFETIAARVRELRNSLDTAQSANVVVDQAVRAGALVWLC